MHHRRLAAAALCLLPLALAACGERAPTDPRTLAPVVRVSIVREAPPGSRSFTGIVAARVQSDLGFRVPGKVLERLVDTGEVVRRGQPLLRIDPIDLGLAAQAAREAVASARALANQAVEDELRYRDLVQAGAVSASFYDQIKARVETANAQLRAAEAQSEVSGNSSRYAVLLADADGIVVETLAEPGQVVTAGQVVIRLAHAGPREALIQLPETLRPTVGSTGQATLFDTDNLEGPARLRRLSAAADPLTRTFEARYVLQGALADAPLGSTVRVTISDSRAEARDAAENAVQVPIGAIFDPGSGPGVWVLAGEPVSVSWRPVRLGGISDELARVYGDIAAGDRVVSLGAHILREGQAVRPAAETAEATAVAVVGARR